MRRTYLCSSVLRVSIICAALLGYGLAFSTTSQRHLGRHVKQGARVAIGDSIGKRRFVTDWRVLRASGDGKEASVTDDDESSDEDDGIGTPQEWEPNFFDRVKSWLRSEEGKEDIRIYSISLFIALFIRLLIIEPRYIPSLSMYPTFDVGDQLAVEKVTKRVRPYNRNEVVVFNPPQTFRDILGEGNKRSKEALIKRIVAVEGDKVEVTRGKLFINGKPTDEPFTAEDAQYEFGPVIVPPGTVLVLGDNRNHSLDGHIWGFLPKQNVIGRAVFIYWPPWRVGNEYLY